MPIDSVVTDRHPASIPPELQESVDRWAARQPAPVSAILFGSRARGDYGPESDWDIALTYDGECPSTKGLPGWLGDSHIDWVPLQRSRALRRLNICSVQHAVARDGIVLFGEPLPRPLRRDRNIEGAWDTLGEAYAQMLSAMGDLLDYWSLRDRDSGDATLAAGSAKAGEMLCKAVLHMRGVEPRRSHSVDELCDALEREFPRDRLVDVLRECNGRSEQAHVGGYWEMRDSREDIDVSERRMVAVLRAAGEVLVDLCDLSSPKEARTGMRTVMQQRELTSIRADALWRTDCPAETRRWLEAEIEMWPDISDLRERLEMPPQGRDSGRAGRDGFGR